MGLTYVTLKVANPARLRAKRRVELLVDTGAVISVIPQETMKLLGVHPITKRKFRAFGGATIEREVGAVVLEYDGALAATEAAFGQSNDTPILGATSLETLGLEVDPRSKKLKHVDLLMM